MRVSLHSIGQARVQDTHMITRLLPLLRARMPYTTYHAVTYIYLQMWQMKRDSSIDNDDNAILLYILALSNKSLYDN